VKKILAVDFDGTLNNENVFPDTGTPNMPLIKKLIALRANGNVKLILNTCRNGKHLAAAVDFCKRHGLEFDAVNENLPSVIEAFGGKDTRKIVASLYIDDRAVTPQDFTETQNCNTCVNKNGCEQVVGVTRRISADSVEYRALALDYCSNYKKITEEVQ